MASGLQFITMNPVTEAMRAGEQRSERRRAADLAARAGEHSLSESQRQSRQAQDVDAAIRAGMVPPEPVAPPPSRPTIGISDGPPMGAHASGVMAEEMRQTPDPQPARGGLRAQSMQPAPAASGPMARVQQNLARTPGGGTIAMQLEQERAKRQDAAESQIVKMLSSPATAEMGMQMAARIGMQVPPNLMRNHEFWQAMDIGKQLYPDDPAAGQRFVTGFMGVPGGDINGRVQAGIGTAGQPQRPPRGGASYVGADGNLYWLGQGSTQVEPVTRPDGTPFAGQKLGAGGKPSVFREKQEAWLAAHPGDIQGALDYARGSKVATEADIYNMASQIVAREFQGVLGGADLADRRRARIEVVMQELRKLNATAAPTAQPAPQAPQAGGAAPPDYPDARQAPDGQWYVERNGQYYRVE